MTLGHSGFDPRFLYLLHDEDIALVCVEDPEIVIHVRDIPEAGVCEGLQSHHTSSIILLCKVLERLVPEHCKSLSRPVASALVILSDLMVQRAQATCAVCYICWMRWQHSSIRLAYHH